MVGKAAALIDPARLAALLKGAAPANRAERRALAEQQQQPAAASPAAPPPSFLETVPGLHPTPKSASAVLGKAAALLDPARLAELLAGAPPQNRAERRALAEQQQSSAAAPAPAGAAAAAAVALAPAAASDTAASAAAGSAPRPSRKKVASQHEPKRPRVGKAEPAKSTPEWAARLEAAKKLKVQTCSSCRKDRPVEEFSMKMKKRKPDSWRCTACIAAAAELERAAKRQRQEEDTSAVDAAEWAARAAAIVGPPKNKKERRIVAMAAKYASSGVVIQNAAAVKPVSGADPAPAVLGKAAALLDPARLAELLAGAPPQNRAERRALAEQQQSSAAAPAPATARTPFAAVSDGGSAATQSKPLTVDECIQAVLALTRQDQIAFQSRLMGALLSST